LFLIFFLKNDKIKRMSTEWIKLAQDTIEQNEINDLADWIKKNNQLTKGPLTKQFEKEFAEYTGSKYAVFVNSGSSANLLMYYACLEQGNLKNKKVIVPSISWITTLSPAIQLGFTPLLCDADKDDLGLDLEHFEQLCEQEKPALAIVVHVLAHLNKMEQIKSICKKHNVQLLEDACEALGSSNKNIKAGNFGLAGSFSFYYGHHISTIEGGMVVTSDRELYNIMLSIRSHGWSRDIEPEFETSWKSDFDVDEFRNLYTFYYPGFNLRSTDLNAFLGLSQIKKLDNITAKRSANFDLYKKYLGLNFFFQKSQTDVLSGFAFGTFAKNRLEVFHHLKKNKIECRPLVCGSMGRQPFWIKKYGEMHLANADKIHDYGLYLPIHDKLTEAQIEFVCSKFMEVAIAI
jgi:CDP-4-dehydro-6-deoxyglucose reductase, E1